MHLQAGTHLPRLQIATCCGRVPHPPRLSSCDLPHRGRLILFLGLTNRNTVDIMRTYVRI